MKSSIIFKQKTKMTSFHKEMPIQSNGAASMLSKQNTKAKQACSRVSACWTAECVSTNREDDFCHKFSSYS